MFTNWLTPTINSSVPDIILEVGPPPYARYAAHSALLSAHSGYLRSAIRPDERNLEMPIYLPNITADQFAPLLTYMYTGFLDLSIENIFGVLLATHVLHMPRALEICRGFLARTQSEGYLGGSTIAASGTFMPAAVPPPRLAIPTTQANNISDKPTSAVKIIRPIASKASGPTLGFVVPPISSILLPSRDTPFKSLLHQIHTEHREAKSPIESVFTKYTTLEVTSQELTTKKSSNTLLTNKTTKRSVHRYNDEEQPNKKCTTTLNNPLAESSITANTTTITTTTTAPTVVTQKVTAPIVICDMIDEQSNNKLETNNNNKIIIDIASCDGPVRFRRVLNDAYNARNCQTTPILSTSTVTNKTIERIHRNVANSFHLQMAKTINAQRQQLLQNHSDESENSSQEIIVTEHSNEQSSPAPPPPDLLPPAPLTASSVLHSSLHKSTTLSKSQEEVYSCVYCKHTFKSQYCYQKHAKRHINPLTMDESDLVAIETSIDSGSEKDDTPQQQKSNSVTTPSPANATNRREVRPLDMNVQYYPCKTCGSKFPSYYFVHKHRKLCHANEEN